MSDGMTQLIRLLGMLGSQHDGEVLSAARMVERCRKKLNKSWPEIFDDRNRASAAEAKIAEIEEREATAQRNAAAAEERARAAEASVLGLAELVTKLRAEIVALKAPPSALNPPHRCTRLNRD